MAEEPDVEWIDTVPSDARRQCKWPGCGKLEDGLTGCPDHGIT